MNLSSPTTPARTKKPQPHSWTRAGLLAWNLGTPQPRPPGILGAVMLAANGPFQIRLQGETGVTYRLEGSTDLLTWTSLITTNLANRLWEWVDPAPGPAPQRFYRAVSP